MSIPGWASNYQGNVHQCGMTVAWSLLLNVTILAAILRHDKVAQIMHLIGGWAILITTYTMILMLLIPLGFNVGLKNTWEWKAHGILGLILLGLVVVQVAGGVMSRLLLKGKTIDIRKLKIIRRCHHFLGYLLAIVYKVQLMWSWHLNSTLYSLIIWEVFWFSLFFIVKFGRKSMAKSIVDEQTQNFICPQIGHSRQIRKVTDNYFIFANYVYDARGLEEIHPGGHRVIELCRGREVDRFIYGMYSVELYPELAPFTHPANSIELAGKPVAKLVTPPTYEGLDMDVLEGKIKFMNCVSEKTQIYSIGIIQEYRPMRFLGYSDIRQLGQYYSLTINGKITRLYTAVNFLNAANVSRMSELLKVQRDSEMKQIAEKRKPTETELSKLGSAQIKQTLLAQNYNSDYLPMMMKVYDQGQLTSTLRHFNFVHMNVKFSCPRGRGIELEDTKAGRVIVVAGGTGLFPFSDLIDLLFKDQAVKEGNKLSQEILNADPVLKQKPFEKFQFVFLIAVNEPEDIHPITFSQLVKLSKNEAKFKIVLRVSRNAEKISNNAGNIEFTREYFNKRVVSEASVKGFSRVWICGPPTMSTNTAMILEENGYRGNSYLLV